MSNVLDHVACDQHKSAMLHLRTAQVKASSEPLTSYALIALTLLRLDKPDRERMRRKFNVSYLMVKEGIAFEKSLSLCELQAHHEVELKAHHEVELGHAYQTAPYATFTHYTAQTQCEQFFQSLAETKLYSFLMDGSTDEGNIEQELVVILSCKKDVSEEVKSHTRFFSMAAPEKADASGLLKCLLQSWSPLGISDVLDQGSKLGVKGKPVLVGTNGASVNVDEQNGIRGMMQDAHTWLLWSWCFAHHLQLACKNALSSTHFKRIEEMLLHLYYAYENSSKKTRELEEVVEELKEVFEFPSGGNKLVR